MSLARLENALGRNLNDVSVRRGSEPAFLVPRIWRVGRIPDHAVHHIRALGSQARRLLPVRRHGLKEDGDTHYR